MMYNPLHMKENDKKLLSNRDPDLFNIFLESLNKIDKIEKKPKLLRPFAYAVLWISITFQDIVKPLK